MAGVGEKCARQLFSTHNVATVERWGDDLLEWVWGMREDTSVATKERAQPKLALMCVGKSIATAAEKTTWHIKETSTRILILKAATCGKAGNYALYG